MFPKLKTVMKGAFYDDVSTIQVAVTQVLTNIPETEFEKSMDKLVDRYKRCIELNGSYFEEIFALKHNTMLVIFYN